MTASIASLRVRFPRDTGFHAALKDGAAAYFDQAGASRWGDRAMHAKTAIIVAWFAASYGLLLAWGGTSGWVATAATLSLALATAGIGFSIMHDANHGAYARSPRVNQAWSLALDFIGASSFLWRRKHNVQHHTFANVDGLDTDIDAGPFLRLAPTQPLRRFQRAQHVYAWPLYGMLLIKWWFVDDFRNLLGGRIGAVPFARPQGRALATLVAGKVAFLGWSIVVPALVFRSAWVAVFFVFGAMVLGIVLSIVFQLAHVLPESQFHAAETVTGHLPTGWAEHQVLATADFAPRNRLLGWYLGGLNFQIEHHLFPDVCHVHYPALSRMVEATCRVYGIPYRAFPSLGSAVAAHQDLLRSLGRPGSVSASARAGRTGREGAPMTGPAHGGAAEPATAGSA